MMIMNTANLTDSELVTEVGRLAGGEREATVALIAHLAEFDARRLCEGLGFSSTFRYCMTELRLSEDAAFNRIEAARAALRYPVILEMLESGALSPTTARLLGRHLTPENHQEVLAAASGRSKHEVEVLLAGVFPQPDVAPSIRRLRSAKAAVAVVSARVAATEAPSSPALGDGAMRADSWSSTTSGHTAPAVSRRWTTSSSAVAHNRYEATLFYGPAREYEGFTRSGTGELGGSVGKRMTPAGAGESSLRARTPS